MNVIISQNIHQGKKEYGEAIFTNIPSWLLSLYTSTKSPPHIENPSVVPALSTGKKNYKLLSLDFVCFNNWQRLAEIKHGP